MKVKIYKRACVVLMALLVISTVAFGQQVSVSTSSGNGGLTLSTNFNDKDFQVKMEEMGRTLKSSLKDLSKNLSVSLNDIAPKISVQLKDLSRDIDLDIKTDLNSNGGDDNGNDEGSSTSEKVKSYSKSYSLDGNDRIRLSNQYGKIVVNTWDRHEVKVDVQVRAEAGDEDEAQKLLDGVQINDSKNGDQVSFRTEINRDNGNGSWKIWNWGGSNKKHKLTINYTVYMPAKTDLNVEDSYGSIELPNLDGRVKINTSYGSAVVQNLSNPANEIEGSYGSLKIGSMNGGKLDFSYGSVNMEDCNNLKADLSYGSFKLGRLKGTGDFDLSYVGGFKIDEVTSSLKKLNINTSYSGASIGLSTNSNFDFDITTSYGGFNYNDDKVTVTSKTPPDGSRHIGTSRNYKGHVGKGGSNATVSINTSYGGVTFD